MNGCRAGWLKRAFGVTSFVLLISAMGCGGVTRTFVETSDDAGVDSSLPGNDAARTDARADGSTATESGASDVAQTDARDVARDATTDARNDALPDIAFDLALDTTVGDIAPDLVNQPPTIVSTIPTDSAVAIAVATTVTIDFSKPMNPATVTAAIQPTAALGTAIWNAAYTSIAFTPAAAFDPMTQYTVTVTGSDTSGRALTGPTSFRFTTGAGADKTAPTIRGTVPTPNAMDVAATTGITVVFTEPMDVGTVTVTAVPDIMLGMPMFNAQNNQISFMPATPLLPYTEYTLTVAGQDPAKNPLAPPTTFKFTTAKPPDTTPPTVVSVAPPDGATGVPSNSSIVITFSEAMNVTASTPSLSPAVMCTGGWAWNQTGTTTTCVPVTPLVFSTRYAVMVPAASPDVAGNPMGVAFSSTFTTGVMPDTTPPTIVSVVPMNRAIGASRGAKIVVNFSEAMDVNSAQAAFSITSPAGISGTFGWGAGNTQMVFTPSVQYPYGSNVSWQVSNAAADAAGNAKTTVDNYAFDVIKTATTNFPCIGPLDGFVNNVPAAYTGSSITMGYSAYTLRGMAAFDLSALPATTTAITSASIYLEQYNVAGSPYGPTRLGDVLWRHVDYGPTLEAADFDTPVLGHPGSGGPLSTDATYTWKSALVTLSVRDDLTNRMARGNRSEFMIRFTNDTVTPVTSDYAYFYACETTAPSDRPYLSVTYEYP
ncbi:MAG TPA: Ig-like domain-containing protein [Polyangiaceae bacterium]|nr:Ig-like domain-containing protein [Polyangiaceae bacterium]